MEKVLWKLATCLAIVLVSFSVYSCSDDDDDSVGSREMLVGRWQGITYTNIEYENGKEIHKNVEDLNTSTYKYVEEFKEDGTWIEEENFNGQIKQYKGKWSYSGNKLTTVDSDGDKEISTVVKMTDTELVLEVRDKYKEDGETYEEYEQTVFKRE